MVLVSYRRPFSVRTVLLLHCEVTLQDCMIKIISVTEAEFEPVIGVRSPAVYKNWRIPFLCGLQ